MCPLPVQAIRWEDGQLLLLDQRRLPHEESYVSCQTPETVAEAIRSMVVRGAPAIAIAAAYGMAMVPPAGNLSDYLESLRSARDVLAASRPTAVNLFWALQRMDEKIQSLLALSPGLLHQALVEEACSIHQQDVAINMAISRHGASLLGADETGIYTHCNTGSLATGGVGTAIGIITQGFHDGRVSRVYAGETRPWMQGARLTTWELMMHQVPVTLVTEGAAGSLMQSGAIDWVIVGADRVALNGDLANKIGTYNLAVLARHHGVRFMAAVPISTFDSAMETGNEMAIEHRNPEEVTTLQGVAIAPENCTVHNPAFDVTPAELIDVIVTEKGVIHEPNSDKILSHLES